MSRLTWPASAWLSRGQSLLEYGLIVATIAVLVLLAAYGFGGLLHDWLSDLLARLVSTS